MGTNVLKATGWGHWGAIGEGDGFEFEGEFASVILIFPGKAGTFLSLNALLNINVCLKNYALNKITPDFLLNQTRITLQF